MGTEPDTGRLERDDGDIPPAVLELLATSTDSVEKLELLLYLARDAARTWTISELARTLDRGRGDTALAAGALAQAGLLEHDGESLRFAPGPTERAAAVASLSALYDTDAPRVLRVMSELALERVRTRAVQAFLLARRPPVKATSGDGSSGAG